MKGASGAFYYLWLALKTPRNASQVFLAFPRLFVFCFCFRKPILFVCRYSGIGDIVCTLPSIAALKQRYPKSFVVYETRRGYMPLVRRCRHVDLVVEEKSPLVKLVQRVFKPKISFCPSLPDERHPPEPREKIHLVEEFGRSFDLKSLNDQPARLTVSARALRQVGQRLRHEQISGKPFVVIHTGPTWKVKEWPEEHWDKLVTELKAGNHIEVIQIGENRTPYGETRESPRATGAINWVGTLTMDQTLALLSMSHLFVGVDSGILHLAGAVDAPCIGVFGPTDPKCFLPRNARATGVTSNVSCLGCHHNLQGPAHWQSDCPHKIRCMTELSVDKVLFACKSLLKEKRKKT
jgi:ADP-heptose:LPS heptosyltransferase